MPFDDPPSHIHSEAIDLILDPALARATIDTLRRAFKEKFGERYEAVVTDDQDGIAAETSFEGFACRQRYAVRPGRVISETKFLGSWEEQLFIGSWLMAALGERMPTWPTGAKICGEWMLLGVHAELLGGTGPDDPLSLIITYSVPVLGKRPAHLMISGRGRR
jgi:hypothetical protein